MPEPIKPTPPKPTVAATPAVAPKPTWTFNADALKKHIDAVTASQESYKGKPGFNPFLWLHAKVDPLFHRLVVKKETTKELHDAIMALPLDHVPSIEVTKKK